MAIQGGGGGYRPPPGGYGAPRPMVMSMQLGGPSMRQTQNLVMTPRVREVVDERGMRSRALLPKRHTSSDEAEDKNNGG